MRLSKFYRHNIHPFQFRIRRLRVSGWTATVLNRDDRKWKTVVYPHGQAVHCQTKREMIAYLDYAYAGKEKAVSA